MDPNTCARGRKRLVEAQRSLKVPFWRMIDLILPNSHRRKVRTDYRDIHLQPDDFQQFESIDICTSPVHLDHYMQYCSATILAHCRSKTVHSLVTKNSPGTHAVSAQAHCRPNSHAHSPNLAMSWMFIHSSQRSGALNLCESIWHLFEGFVSVCCGPGFWFVATRYSNTDDMVRCGTMQSALFKPNPCAPPLRGSA